MPAALNHSAISWLSAAAPEMKKRTRPPKRSRILAKTRLGRTDRAAPAGAARACGPPRTRLVGEHADLERLLEDGLLDAALGRLHGDDPGVRLLEDPRRGAHERRPDDPEVVDDLVDAPVDGGGVADRQLGGHQHLAEGVGHRQPAELEVLVAQDALCLDGRALVDPRAVPEPHALRAGPWYRRCRSGWRAGRAGSSPRSSRSRRGARRGRCRPGCRARRARSPSRRRWSPSKVTTLPRWGSSALSSLSLAICSSSSAKTTRHSESLRMYAVSSALVDG